MSSGNGLTRVTVNLTRPAHGKMCDLAEKTGMSKTDVVNKAVQVYALVEDLLDRGRREAGHQAPRRHRRDDLHPVGRGRSLTVMPDDFAAAVAGRPGWQVDAGTARYDPGNGWTALVTAVWNPGGRRLGWVWHVAWLEHGTARHTLVAHTVQQAIKTAEQIDRKT